MNIPESDHAEINQTLLEADVFRSTNDRFPTEILKQIKTIFDEALRLPEWNSGENYMNAGIAAVIVFLKETYPWLSEKARYMIQHECMMYMK